MKQYIAIAIAILFMAIPVSAYDQTYIFTKDDFTLAGGEDIPCDFTLTLYPSYDGRDLYHTFQSPETYLSGSYRISISPELNVENIIHDTRFSNNFNITDHIPGHSLLYYSPYFENDQTVYVEVRLYIEHTSIENHTSTYGHYLLKETCTLGSNVLTVPDPQEPNFPIDGYITPSAPSIDSFTIEQYHTNNRYNVRHAFHFSFSDLNGHNDISSITLSITDLNSTHPEYATDNRTITPTITPINISHAKSSFGVYELYPPYTYSITLTLTDSTSLSSSATILHTPKGSSTPVILPMFTINPVYFSDTPAGSTATASLTINNNNGPEVKVNTLSFADFKIHSNSGTLIDQINAISLTFSIPTTTLSSGESLCIPLSLYIPPGTKAGSIHSSGSLILETLA
ncbi:hypothetical protein Mpsy_1092 [Methanolobus psychrophilus R15]|nr:hypothetical protein Mpsy_1092 [Methanolobus psychrophilus R15]